MRRAERAISERSLPLRAACPPSRAAALGLAVALLAVALPARGFESRDLVLDPATGLEWLSPGASLGRSYDDLVGVDGSDEFAPGGDFAGFRHATVPEAESFLANAGFDALATPSVDLFDEARSLLLRLGGPTFVSGDLERILAITGSSTVAAGSRDRVLLSLDHAAGTGDARVDGAICS